MSNAVVTNVILPSAGLIKFLSSNGKFNLFLAKKKKIVIHINLFSFLAITLDKMKEA